MGRTALAAVDDEAGIQRRDACAWLCLYESSSADSLQAMVECWRCAYGHG